MALFRKLSRMRNQCVPDSTLPSTRAWERGYGRASLQRSKVNSHGTRTELNVRDCRGQRSILMPLEQNSTLQRSKVKFHATRTEPSVSQICIPTWPPTTVLLLMITLHTRSRQPNQQLSQTLTSSKVQLFATLAVAVLI